jgi:hypothetical protein
VAGIQPPGRDQQNYTKGNGSSFHLSFFYESPPTPHNNYFTLQAEDGKKSLNRLKIHTPWQNAIHGEKCIAWTKDFRGSTQEYAFGVKGNNTDYSKSSVQRL